MGPSGAEEAVPEFLIEAHTAQGEHPADRVEERSMSVEQKYATEKSDVAPMQDGECAEPQEQAFDRLRGEILAIEKKVRALVPVVGGGNPGEVKANLTLSFRHLEDARLRLGKAIQHSGDGVSCYDR